MCLIVSSWCFFSFFAAQAAYMYLQMITVFSVINTLCRVIFLSVCTPWFAQCGSYFILAHAVLIFHRKTLKLHRLDLDKYGISVHIQYWFFIGWPWNYIDLTLKKKYYLSFHNHVSSITVGPIVLFLPITSKNLNVQGAKITVLSEIMCYQCALHR